MAVMICAYCKEPISSASDCVKYRSKVYHNACLGEAKAALKQAALKKDKTLQKSQGQTALEHYLCHAFELNTLTPLLQKQLEQFRKEWNCSWEEILKVARYWFEIVPKEEAYPVKTLGILPYYKDEALHFWAGVEAANEYNLSKTLKQEAVTLPYRSKEKYSSSRIRMEDL